MVLSTIGVLCLWRLWSAQLLCISHESIALVTGISVSKQRLSFMLLLAGFTAMSMHAVGSLLVSSLLILPALAARLLSQSPSQMVGYSLLYGVVGLWLGIAISLWLDIASGLCIIIVLSGLFLCTFAWQRLNATILCQT